ncbi:MAG: ribulose-phosphate 3-epimerase [Acidobacteriota bacterium]|nr:ribulose-phosphate 3-epimerase [Acidobacteriota bacterium]
MPASPLKHDLKKSRPVLSAGILTADLANLGAEARRIESAGVRLLHFDVMDGCFCPMMTVGPPLIKALKTTMIKDVHLMISEPLDKVKDYAAAGADILTVHFESCRHIHRVLQTMGALTAASGKSITRGLALNPGTAVEAIEPLLGELDMILLLAVNPGWSGQHFLPSTFRRIERVRRMIGSEEILLGVDGGITQQNAGEIARTGVDLVVAGSAIFDGKAPDENARQMLESLHKQAG